MVIGAGTGSGAGTGTGAGAGGAESGGKMAKVCGTGLLTAGTKVFLGSGFFGTTGIHSLSVKM